MGFSWHPSIRISISKNSKIQFICILYLGEVLSFSKISKNKNDDNMQTEEILENIPNDNLI